MTDFDENEDEQEVEPSQSGEPDWLKQMRRENRSLKKQNTELQSTVEAFNKKEREATTRTLLTKAGFTSDAADVLLPVVGDEPSEERIAEIAAKLGMTAKQEPEPDLPRNVHAPTPVGAPPAPPLLSREEIDELMKTDPNRALQLLREGKVKFRHQSSYEVAAGKR